MVKLTESQAAQLAEHITAHVGTSVLWSVRDYLAFLRGCLQIVLGREIAPLLKVYASREILETEIGLAGGLEVIVTNFVGHSPTPVFGFDVRRGDILLYHPWGKDTLGVAMGKEWMVAFTDAGLVWVPTFDAEKVWRL